MGTENLRTVEMCPEAVKQDYQAFKHVPENLKTAKILFEMENYIQPDLEWEQIDDDEFWEVGDNENS